MTDPDDVLPVAEEVPRFDDPRMVAQRQEYLNEEFQPGPLAAPELLEEEVPPPLDYVMKVEPGTVEASTVTPIEPVGEFVAPDA